MHGRNPEGHVWEAMDTDEHYRQIGTGKCVYLRYNRNFDLKF